MAETTDAVTDTVTDTGIDTGTGIADGVDTIDVVNMEDSAELRPHPLADSLGPGNYKPLARKAGLSAVHVSKALRGKVGLTLGAAARIADAAEVSIDDLLDYIDSQAQIKVES